MASGGAVAVLGQQDQEEVATRRSQFQMKKKKKNDAAAKATEKKELQQQKKEQREQKKQEKLRQKEEKARQKHLAKEQKAQQKATKMLAGKKSRRKGVKRSYKKAIGENCTEPTTMDVDEQIKQKKVRRRTLRKTSFSSPDQQFAKMKRASRYSKMKKRRASRNKPMSRPALVEASGCSATIAAESPSHDKTDSSDTKKRQTRKHEKKAAAEKPAPCPRIMKLVQDTHAECKASHCVHPNFVVPESFDGKQYQLSVYWSHCSVGVKILSSCLPAAHKKTKSKSRNPPKGAKKWCQIAYFSCKTDCIYTNMVLAYEFVSWSGMVRPLSSVFPMDKKNHPKKIPLAEFFWVFSDAALKGYDR